MGTAHAAAGQWNNRHLTLLRTVGGQGPLWMRDTKGLLGGRSRNQGQAPFCQVDEVVFWDMATPSQCVLNSLKDSGQAGTVQAVLVGREKSHQGLAAIFKAFIPGSGLGQVEGTKVAQGTRLRALQPGTKRPVSPFLPQQAPLCQLPARVEGMGKKSSGGPSGLCSIPLAVAPGHSSASSLAVTLIDIVFHQSHHLFKLVL